MNPARRTVSRWSGSRPVADAMDELAVEEPLEIQVETRPISVTMRTPGHDDELAAGFLASEGVIRSGADIRDIRPYPRNDSGNAVNVFLADGVEVDFNRLTRHVFASSSCGICGKASIDSVHARFPAIETSVLVDASVLPLLPGRMRESQGAFDRTGGLHAAAVFSLDGSLRIIREDVGRHNAVDKVIGAALWKAPFDLSESVLLVSGRVSFEILQKALAARIPVIAAISAPSSLAADFAAESGQILIGFLRGDAFNVYAGKERVR